MAPYVTYRIYMCVTISAVPELKRLPTPSIQPHRYQNRILPGVVLDTLFLINSGPCTRNGASTGNDWCVLSFDSPESFFHLWFCRLGSQLSRRQWAYAFALVTTLFFTCKLRAGSIEPRTLTSLTGGFAYGVSATLCCTKPDLMTVFASFLMSSMLTSKPYLV